MKLAPDFTLLYGPEAGCFGVDGAPAGANGRDVEGVTAVWSDPGPGEARPALSEAVGGVGDPRLADGRARVAGPPPAATCAGAARRI